MRKIIIFALIGLLLGGCTTIQAETQTPQPKPMADFAFSKDDWQKTVKILEVKLIPGKTYDEIYVRAQNIGDRTLNFLAVDVNLLDKDGKPIKTQTALYCEYLKPNFIQEGTTLITSRLPEWSGEIKLSHAWGMYEKRTP